MLIRKKKKTIWLSACPVLLVIHMILRHETRRGENIFGTSQCDTLFYIQFQRMGITFCYLQKTVVFNLKTVVWLHRMGNNNSLPPPHAFRAENTFPHLKNNASDRSPSTSLHLCNRVTPHVLYEAAEMCFCSSAGCHAAAAESFYPPLPPRDPGRKR